MQSKYIHYSNLSSRLDPLYYLSDLAIFTDRQITASIGELCSSMYSGFAAGKETQVKKESGYIQIRPTNIMPDGRLSFEKNVYVPKNYTQMFTFNGVTYDSNNNYGGNIVSFNGNEYYLVTVTLGSAESAKSFKHITQDQ